MNKQPKTSLVLPILLIIGPTLLIVLAFLLMPLAQATEAPVADENLFGDPTPANQALNIFMFLLIGVGLVGILPGFIVGIVLLTQRRKARRLQKF